MANNTDYHNEYRAIRRLFAAGWQHIGNGQWLQPDHARTNARSVPLAEALLMQKLIFAGHPCRA